MLDAGKSRFRRKKHIETMAGDRKTEPVGFLGARFDRFWRHVFVELDDLDAFRFLFPHGGDARLPEF